MCASLRDVTVLVTSTCKNICNRKLYNVCFIIINQYHYRPDVPRGFQEVKVTRLRDNGTGCGRLSALSTHRIYTQEILLVLISVRG